MFVEIHTVGQDDWTTLADDNGHTSDDVGLSCPTTGDGSAWQTNHPFLAHYQTVIDAGDDCTPTGSSGAWNAATGNSGGWQEWSLPIPAAYHGKNVEIAVVGRHRSRASRASARGSTSCASSTPPTRRSTPPTRPSRRASTAGRCPGRPARPAARGQSTVTGWERAQSAPFVETPIVTTTDTVYTGFGVRGDHRRGEPHGVHAGRADAPRRAAQAGVRRAGAADRDRRPAAAAAATAGRHRRAGADPGTRLAARGARAPPEPAARPHARG